MVGSLLLGAVINGAFNILLCVPLWVAGFPPWRVRPHRVPRYYKIAISSFLATGNPTTQWTKERGIIGSG